ncbi:Hypothetical protein SRAE_X000026500 [Strongyloides ratti]|uniref:Transthyretin-like family-containing protein n=1 Tax=Strongyloides ratti TaxID=34506 RepID=A0A090LM62_STRRB|nr:Hypothetical protein SRAE_X000026500 [Strongyloides ratti]CEF70935.1 Hypothetical protein SRAE_X000026500 [Strongyloides ratti]
MQSIKSYLFKISISIAIFIVVSNCQLINGNAISIQAKENWFVGNVEVTCNEQPQDKVNISIFKLENNDYEHSFIYVVLNSSLTDKNGYGQVTGHWKIPPDHLSCKMCLFHNCPPPNSKDEKKEGEYKYSYCFSFGQSYIKNTLEEAQKNDFDEAIELTHQSFDDFVEKSKSSNDCPSEGRKK